MKTGKSKKKQGRKQVHCKGKERRQEEVGKVTSTVGSEGMQEVGKDRIKYKEDTRRLFRQERCRKEQEDMGKE